MNEGNIELGEAKKYLYEGVILNCEKGATTEYQDADAKYVG